MRIALFTGWGMSASVWPVEKLQEACGYEVVVFDLMTVSASQNAFTQHHDFDYLIGWSLGGVMALEWALHCQAKVLLLASLPIMVQRADFPGGINQSAFAQFAEFFERDAAGALQHFVRLQSLGSVQPRVVQKKLTAHLLSQPSDLQYLQTADACAAWQVLQQQQRLQAVYAQQDVLLTAETVHQALAVLPEVAVHWVAGGHAECMLTPEQWVMLL